MPQQPRSRFGLFFLPLASIPYLLARPRLLVLAIAPLILNLIVFATVFGLLTHFVTTPWFQAGDEMGTQVEKFLDVAMEIILGGVLVTFTLVVAAGISFLLIIPIGAPFCDLIAERIEADLLAEKPALIVRMSFWPSVRHALFEAIRRIAYFLPLYVTLFAVAWIPVIGSVTAAILGFMANALFLSMDGFSYALDRRGMLFRDKREFFRQNKGLWMPFGAGLATMALIPCNILWLPILSCVGATRLYCEKKLAETPAPPTVG